MTYQDFDTLPERGKPRPKVVYGDHHRLVLRALRAGPLSDQAIYDRIVKHQGKVISEPGVRTRRKELQEDFALVKRVGTGLTEARRSCAVWGLTDAGNAKADAEFQAARQMTLDVERAA